MTHVQYKTETVLRGSVSFADIIAIISETEEDGKKQLNYISKIASRIYIRITDKTRTLNTFRTISGCTMQQLDKFKYLGEYMTGRNNCSKGMGIG